jgi:very-short-patch-repair endonuclease
MLPPLGREQAALLAIDVAALSHGSAGFVWGTLAAHPSGPVEVTTTANRRSREGIRVHRTAHLGPDDVTTHRGLVLTSAVRTVADLAPRLSTGGLEQVLAETLVKRLATEGELRERGGAKVAALLAEGPRFTRAESERLLLRIVDGAGLPRPQTNARIAGWEVDAMWRAHRVALEVDGGTTHGHRFALERDHRRDLAVQAAGWRTVRVTWRQLGEEPLRVAAHLARVLSG